MSKTTDPKARPPEEIPPEAHTEAEEAEEQALSRLQNDLEKFRDLALRSQADLDNYRKRAAREKEEAIRFANNTLLERLLPILDSFDLGLAAARSEGEQSPVFQGMNMVRKQLDDFLRDCGLEPVEAEGQKFDPNRHEAMGQEPSEEVPEGHVIRQMRKGFLLRDRLLRPASVFVSTGPSAGADA